MVMDHHLALDFLLAKQEGVCAITNISCYTYINIITSCQQEVYTE
jgi:hypothetical protein